MTFPAYFFITEPLVRAPVVCLIKAPDIPRFSLLYILLKPFANSEERKIASGFQISQKDFLSDTDNVSSQFNLTTE